MTPLPPTRKPRKVCEKASSQGTKPPKVLRHAMTIFWLEVELSRQIPGSTAEETLEEKSANAWHEERSWLSLSSGPQFLFRSQWLRLYHVIRRIFGELKVKS